LMAYSFHPTFNPCGVHTVSSSIVDMPAMQAGRVRRISASFRFAFAGTSTVLLDTVWTPQGWNAGWNE